MSVYKEEKTNTWRVVFRLTDWTGERRQTQKRGFKTKREAQAWEREQLNKVTADVDMTFASFIERYTEDVQPRRKENTWSTKEHIIRTKLVPYFGKLRMNAITAQQIITWQNEMINHRDENGKPYSPVYLKTINNQLSAIFNHAVRYYNLRENPCKKAGSMGKKKNREMLYWTKEEYLRFAESMMDKPISYYAFEMLYWCGIREGELLALTPADFDWTEVKSLRSPWCLMASSFILYALARSLGRISSRCRLESTIRIVAASSSIFRTMTGIVSLPASSEA